MYKPIVEELIKMWFEEIQEWCFYVYECRQFSDDNLNSYVWIHFSNYKKPRWSISYWWWDIYTRNFFPDFKNDIETMIRLFTPYK